MIRENVKRILSELPPNVKLIAAAKTRSIDEIKEAIEAGIEIVGENYIQEAEAVSSKVKGESREVKFHFIGHLQTNKVKKAVQLFDMIETVDSFKLAGEIDKQCAKIGKVMDILIEINSGREKQKAGVYPEKAEELIKGISQLKNIKVRGLMTMGPLDSDPRPYFKETKQLFDRMKLEILSMGMSDSYKTAIEEGATMVRIGTAIFGERHA